MTAVLEPRVISAMEPDEASFARFGRVFTLGDAADPRLIFTERAGWADAYTRDGITRERPSLGVTSVGGAPFVCTVMERHVNVEEALLPAASAVVLAVAEATEGDAPRAEDVRAFLLAPGTVVVLRPGVWHDACRGANGPTSYYWLASCDDAGSSPWTPLAGGPVEVRVAA